MEPKHLSVDYPAAHEGSVVEQVLFCSPGHSTMIHELFHLILSPCCQGEEVRMAAWYLAASQEQPTTVFTEDLIFAALLQGIIHIGYDSNIFYSNIIT